MSLILQIIVESVSILLAAITVSALWNALPAMLGRLSWLSQTTRW
jgi:hypothetical protein